MLNYDFVGGDTASIFGPRTLQDSGGSGPLNLTGATVNLLLYQNMGGNIPSGTPPTFSRTMTILSATGGTVQYQFIAGDLVSGILTLVIQVVNGNGTILTETNPQVFTVR